MTSTGETARERIRSARSDADFSVSSSDRVPAPISFASVSPDERDVYSTHGPYQKPGSFRAEYSSVSLPKELEEYLCYQAITFRA